MKRFICTFLAFIVPFLTPMAIVAAIPGQQIILAYALGMLGGIIALTFSTWVYHRLS